ncbi:hypothetical protein [Mycobacterium marinum]|uniref:hypothetical protein n=1 Tax=Mycobacterium marinum TaxID=1781 RepID=UPI00402639E6
MGRRRLRRAFGPDWGNPVPALTVHINTRTDDTSGSKILALRWVVEHTVGSVCR